MACRAFGEDWIHDDSVEQVDKALPADADATFDYLAAPETLLGLLGDYAQPASGVATEDLDDEVDVDAFIDATADE